MWLFLIVVTIEQGIFIKNSVPLNSQFRVIDTRKYFIRINLHFVIFLSSELASNTQYTIFPHFVKIEYLAIKQKTNHLIRSSCRLRNNTKPYKCKLSNCLVISTTQYTTSNCDIRLKIVYFYFSDKLHFVISYCLQV